MGKKTLFLLSCILCLTACEKREFVILVEQPTDKNLDNLDIKLLMDNDASKISNTKLKYSNVTP